MLKWIICLIFTLIFGQILETIYPGYGYNLALVLVGLVMGFWIHEGVLAGFYNGMFTAVILSLIMVMGIIFINSYSESIGQFSDSIISILLMFIITFIVKGFFMGMGGAMGGFLAQRIRRS